MTKTIALSLVAAASISLAACTKEPETNNVANAVDNAANATDNAANAVGNASDNVANAAGAMASNASNAQ